MPFPSWGEKIKKSKMGFVKNRFTKEKIGLNTSFFELYGTALKNLRIFRVFRA
jgi:hypothetical protein